MPESPLEIVAALPCWTGPVDPEPLPGGITNTSFKVIDGGRTFVARIGGDIPAHQIMRFNDIAASRAAHAAGLSPAVHHAQDNAIVLDFVEGKTLGPEDVRAPETLPGVVDLIHRCHHHVPAFLQGPVMAFWVFHVVRNYARLLKEGASPHAGLLPELETQAERLEESIGRIQMVFSHNDLLAANLIDDGKRLWLIDWDYAGFNSPLFDLAGLASNSDMGPEQELLALELYYGERPDGLLIHRYLAMKCASLLRETLWSMVSELHSSLDFDFAAYTAENLERYRRASEVFRAS